MDIVKLRLDDDRVELEKEKFNKSIAYLNLMREAIAVEGRKGIDGGKWANYEAKWVDPDYDPNYYTKFHTFIGLFETDTLEGRDLFTDVILEQYY
tara:strand:- start:5955 stop:6239 length:285 start_codon:yes stop_codon:yes gene_type:complete